MLLYIFDFRFAILDLAAMSDELQITRHSSLVTRYFLSIAHPKPQLFHKNSIAEY